MAEIRHSVEDDPSARSAIAPRAAAGHETANARPDRLPPESGPGSPRWYLALPALLLVSFATLNWPFSYVIELQGESPQSFFVFGPQFLQRFLSRPGGLLQYAGRFLGQSYEHAWLGAAVASACIVGFAALLGGVTARLQGTVRAWQVLLPGLLLLALHASPAHLHYHPAGLIACCAVFLGYLATPSRGVRYAYAFVATPAVYAALGVYVWLFVAWVLAASRAQDTRRSESAVKALYVLYGLAVPLVAYRWFCLISLRDAFIAPLDPRVLSTWRTMSGAADGVLAVALVVALFAVPFGNRLRWGAGLGSPPPRRRRALAVELAVLAGLLLAVAYDAGLSGFVSCRQLYRHRQWDALLDRSARLASQDLLMQFMTNFSLAQKRELLDVMFHYPQPFGTRGLALNFVTWQTPEPGDNDTERALYNGDLYYEMGHVNAAFRHAYNHLVGLGETYAAYERMVQCNLANGNYDLATKHLNILDRTAFHRAFARRYQAIAADPKVADRELRGIRELLPRVELPMYESPIAPAIMVLQTRPNNRLAFDYLTAWSLLDKRPADLCMDMRAYRAVGYSAPPIHCQEALLLLVRRTTDDTPARWLDYDSAVLARMDRFLSDVSHCDGRETSLLDIQRAYGDTYWYYYYFVKTPVQRQGDAGGMGATGTTRKE